MTAETCLPCAGDRGADLPRTIGGGRERCSGCAYRTLCFPPGLEESELARLEGLVGGRRRVARGDILFRAGQPFVNLFAVRYGHLLTSRVGSHGERRIVAFQMAGDLLGLEAICTGEHACTAVALEDSEVCELPYARLQAALAELPAMMDHFLRTMSRAILFEQAGDRFLGMQRADERLAGMLLDLSARYAMRGFSPRHFHLRMSRDDMARYLGLTLETVSRLLGRLRDRGMIRIDRRDLEILDVQQLEALAAGRGPEGVVHVR